MLDFSTLYGLHARDVHRFALFLCGDPALADDIASETFVRAWSARERVDLGSVKAYLFAIARNLFLHELRRPARRSVELGELHGELASAEPSPERSAAARSELTAVLADLQALDPDDRAALAMRVEDQLPYEEIARVLGLSLSAVKVKVHRARLRLGEARARRSENSR